VSIDASEELEPLHAGPAGPVKSVSSDASEEPEPLRRIRLSGDQPLRSSAKAAAASPPQ
jgi:hypothetical protein